MGLVRPEAPQHLCYLVAPQDLELLVVPADQMGLVRQDYQSYPADLVLHLDHVRLPHPEAR